MRKNLNKAILVFFVFSSCASLHSLKSDKKVGLKHIGITLGEAVLGTGFILYEMKMRNEAAKQAYQKLKSENQAGEYTVKIPVQSPLVFVLGIGFLVASGIDSSYLAYKGLTKKKIEIREEAGIPNLDIESEKIDTKNVLEDTRELKFLVRVKNKGKSTAEDVAVYVTPKKIVEGVKFKKENALGDIRPKEQKKGELVFGGEGIKSEDRVEFEIVARERKGFDSDPINLSFPVKPFYKPEFNLRWAVDIGDENYVLPGREVKIFFTVENEGKGEAEHIRIYIKTPKDVIITSKEKKSDNEIEFNISTLYPNESRKFSFEFAVLKRFEGDKINIQVDVSEKRADVSKVEIFDIGIGKYVKTIKEVRLEEIKRKVQKLEFELENRSDVDVWIMELGKPLRQSKSAYSLIVGIENYKYLPVAKYAKQDALAVKEYFEKVVGIPKENIILLLDGDATKTTFENYILNRIPPLIKEDSVFYFYFSGHGIPGKDGVSFALFDTDPSSPEISSVYAKDVWEAISRYKGKVISIVDACFSGTSRGANLFAEARPVYFRINPSVGVSSNTTILLSSKAEQISNSEDAFNHGVFTYHLLKVLMQNARKDKLWLQEEFLGAIKESVADHTMRKWGIERRQEPEFIVNEPKYLW